MPAWICFPWTWPDAFCRAGQGVGVGILTARLGIKAVGLLRPLPWHPDRQLKLSAVRKQVVSKVAALLAK